MLKGIALPQVLQDINGTLSCVLTDGHLVRLRALGVQVVRVELLLPRRHIAAGGWHTWDETAPLYRELVARLEAGGVRIVLLVGNQIVPQCGQGDWNNDHLPLPDDAAPGVRFGAFLDAYGGALARAVGDLPAVTHWEIWNEPNAYTASHGPVPGFPAGGTFLYPQLYALVLSAAYARVKCACPEATVITGGLFAQNIANLQPDSAGATYLAEVLRWLDRAGAPEAWPFDAVGQHYYLDRGGLLDPYHLWQYLAYLAPLVEGKPVWVTEAGWNTADDATVQLHQAANLALLFDYCSAARAPRIACLCWFTLEDQPASGDKTALYRGLYAAGLLPKPSLVPFALYRGQEPTPADAPT